MGSHRWIVKLLFALLLAVMLAFPTGVLPADAATFDSEYCTTQLSGTWNGAQYTCTIESGNTGTMATILTLSYHLGGVRDRIVVSTGATLNVTGSLYLNGGELHNDGSASVGDSGSISVRYASDMVANGLLTNDGALTNDGEMAVLHAEFVEGALRNYGTFTNNYTLNNYSTTFENWGTFTSNSFFNNYGGAEVRNGGAFENTGFLYNDGNLTVGVWASYAGDFMNSSTGNLIVQNGGSLTLTTGASLTNNGTIDIDAASRMHAYGPLTNAATGEITSDGTFHAENLSNLAGSHFTNNGTGAFTVGASVSNNGLFDNYGALAFDASANTFHNGNQFNNYGTIASTAIIRNLTTAVIENRGVFNNNFSARLYNDGTINNYCLSIFQDSGLIFGNAPVDLCVAPHIGSADHTTFIVGTAGSFAVTTTGSPTPDISRSGDALPSGATFTDSGNGTALLAGTPAAGTVGVYHFTFTANNGVSPNATQSFTLTVNKANATSSVTSSQHPSSFGQSVAFTAHVSPAHTGGTVEFRLDGNTISGCGAISLVSGEATCSPGSLSVGSHAVIVYYSGDANYNPSDNSTSPLTQTVNRADTTTTLYTSGTPSILGDSVTFTAQVIPTPDGGTVTFEDGSTDLCTGVALSGGQAICATSSLTIGLHTITASYSGDANYNASSTNGTQTVNYPVPTITSLSPTSAAVNAPDFTLTITGTNLFATSVVRWNGSDRATTYVSSTKLTASITKNGLSAAGNASVTVYNPTPGGGISNPAIFIITPANSAVTLTSSLNPSTLGEAVTFAATVTQTVVGASSRSLVRRLEAVPGGTMTFYASGGVLGTAALNATGLATFTTSSLVAGTHPITATYSGDANFGGGASNQVNQVVNNPTPTITTINPTSASVNAPDFTLNITGTNFVNSSVVRWNGSDRATTFGSSTKLTATISKNDLSAAGTAQVTVYNPAPGGGTSNAQTFTITPTASAITVVLTSSCNPCMLVQTVRLTAAVTNTVGASSSPASARRLDAVPGGTITFQDSGTNIAGCVNVGLSGAGQAVCATVLAGGRHTITAQYSGDANFNPALGTLTQDISYLLLLPSIKKNAP